MPENRTTEPARGYSLLELVIAIAVTVTALAVALPIVATTFRVADLTAAQAEMASAIRRASEAAATGGTRLEFDATAVPVPAGVAINTTMERHVAGAIVSSDITFQGGTGYPWVESANQAAAVVLADRSDVTRTVAVVVGASGTVLRMRMVSPNAWEVEP
jgi:type II secretory pathway pseudopilin PulG